MDIPQVGFGTLGTRDPKLIAESVKYAIEECGVRHIDLAPGYGNQKEIGAALKEIWDKGIIKRSDVFITSKLWCTKHRRDLVVPDIKNTLKDLQLEYLDLFLIHFPCAFESHEYVDETPEQYWPRDKNGNIIRERIDILETWAGMEECQKLGLARHIGVSNFTIEMLERIRYFGEIQPYCNQVIGHVYLQQKPLLNYLTERGIFLTMHTCLARPPTKAPTGYALIEDPTVLKIAKETGKSPGQVCLRYLTQLSPLISVIPLSTNQKRIKENAEIYFDLSEDQMERLSKLDCNFRPLDISQVFGFDALCIGAN